MQPERIWIAEIESVPNDYYGQMLERVLLNVWLLDKNGVTPKDDLEFKRFISVHTLFDGLRLPTKENSRILEIGYPQFAKFENQTNFYYFDYHFGGFCAEGFSVEFNKIDEVVNKTGIWIS